MVSIDFTTAWHEGDIQLVISEDGEDEDKTLFASKCTLSIWSPVFAAMFKEDTFKEGTNKQVKMPNKKYEDVLELLKVLHPPNKPVTLDNAYHLLPLAHEYQIQDVVDRCEKKIITDKPTIANIKLADDYNLKKLHAHSTDQIAKLTLAQIKGDENYSTVSDKYKAELMIKRVKGLETERESMVYVDDACKLIICGKKQEEVQLRLKHVKCQEMCFKSDCVTCFQRKKKTILEYISRNRYT